MPAPGDAVELTAVLWAKSPTLPELPHVSGAEAIRALERLWFAVERQRGSHVMLRRGSVGCVVLLHREIKRWTLGGILRQAGIDAEAFVELLGR